MLRPFEVTTNSGKVLRGNIFKTPRARTVVILVTGVEGNINNNPFYTIIGKKLETANIDLVVAHPRDAFNHITAFNRVSGERETYGAFNEDFHDSDEDVEAYLAFARQAGYDQIVLGGQSLGANKVIHYLAGHPDAAVDKFLLMSPVNVEVLRQSITKRQQQTIQEWLANGKANKVLPFRLFRWLSSTALTASRWLTDDTLNNVHPGQTGDFTQLEKINYSGALLIGTRDHFTGGNPVNYLQNINHHLPTANDNQLVFIKNTGHIYRQKEGEVADEILKLLKQWAKE